MKDITIRLQQVIDFQSIFILIFEIETVLMKNNPQQRSKTGAED